MWLLDTNVWIAYLGKKPSPVKERITNLSSREILMCDVVKAELYYGAYHSMCRDANLQRLETLFSRLVSLPFDGAAARHCGEIRAFLAQAGKPIGPYDVLIAAIARCHGVTLVTHNTVEFSRVPGLLLEDWE